MFLRWVVTRRPSGRVTRKALLSAGSDDSIKPGLNGALYINPDIQRGAAPGQEKILVELRTGWNRVLLKITQGHGGWGFYFDMLTPDGKPIPGLVYGLGPERVARSTSGRD